MKKINLILVFVLSFMFNCKAQSQLQSLSNYTSDIVGIWISNDDPTYKIEFTNNGIQKEYINDELQEESYQYSLSTSCGSNSNNGYDIFLKRLTSVNDFVCDIINNIHTNTDGVTTLSITSERGKLELYTKQ